MLLIHLGEDLVFLKLGMYVYMYVPSNSAHNRFFFLVFFILTTLFCLIFLVLNAVLQHCDAVLSWMLAAIPCGFGLFSSLPLLKCHYNLHSCPSFFLSLFPFKILIKEY